MAFRADEQAVQMVQHLASERPAYWAISSVLRPHSLLCGKYCRSGSVFIRSKYCSVTSITPTVVPEISATRFPVTSCIPACSRASRTASAPIREVRLTGRSASIPSACFIWAVDSLISPTGMSV